MFSPIQAEQDLKFDCRTRKLCRFQAESEPAARFAARPAVFLIKPHSLSISESYAVLMSPLWKSSPLPVFGVATCSLRHLGTVAFDHGLQA
jgi:hypothetical protein